MTHKFYVTIDRYGQKLDLTCYMDADSFKVKSICWDGIDVTELLSCVSGDPCSTLAGEIPVDRIATERYIYNGKVKQKEGILAPVQNGRFHEFILN